MVYGFGINDVDGKTWTTVGLKKVIDPFYDRWKGMLRRCYSPEFHKKYMSYNGCKVDDNWRYFSNFKKWMSQCNWQGMHLDKDLIGDGKIYSETNCIFIDPLVNSFITDRHNHRNPNLPIGVYQIKSGNYKSHINEFDTGKTKYLGVFKTPEEAFNCWFENKLVELKKLKGLQGAEHLLSFYERNYQNYLTGKK